MTLESLTPSSESFRAAVGAFAASVNIITTVDECERPCGMTATAFSSVSMDPLLVLVCVNRATRTYQHVARRGRFAVNILGADAQEISDFCSRPGGDKTLAQRWLAENNRWQSPTLAGALVVLDCRVHQDIEAGTHAVLIGEVVGIGMNREHQDAEPLVHFRGAYRRLTANGATRMRPKPLPIIVEEMS
jgi:flavin reductase (DIM6/NTAB) family NADH-FMN oxidoreductase RutF